MAMSNAEALKTTPLPILQAHGEECGDGSCGCGCGVPFVTVEAPEEVTEIRECCEPFCGPDTCG